MLSSWFQLLFSVLGSYFNSICFSFILATFCCCIFGIYFRRIRWVIRGFLFFSFSLSLSLISFGNFIVFCWMFSLSFSAVCVSFGRVRFDLWAIHSHTVCDSYEYIAKIDRQTQIKRRVCKVCQSSQHKERKKRAIQTRSRSDSSK